MAWAAVCATVRSVDVIHSLIFTYGLQQMPDSPPWAEGAAPEFAQKFEGPWWKQERNISGFVTLSNLTGNAVHATVRVTDEQDQQIGTDDVTISPRGTKLVTLAELASSTGDHGGIYVAHDGPQHSVAINGALMDESVGYSASLPLLPTDSFAAGTDHSAPTANSVAELGLMTGMADPMMNFPAETVFTPYSVVRNLSSEPVQVTPTLWWMSGGAAQSAHLQALAIGPHRTANLNVPALLASAGLKTFHGSVNLVLDGQCLSAPWRWPAEAQTRKTPMFSRSRRVELVKAPPSRWHTGAQRTATTPW